MKRILINATQKEELRVALVDGQQLYDLDIETTGREQKKSNIYKGKITRVEPSLEAAFIEYGADRHGFLPLKEISPSYFAKPPTEGNRPTIKEALKEGQEILVQVGKEERGNKGAALTTFISLAGRYLVLMPNNPRAGGVSRRIEGDDRSELRDAMNALEIPEGMGLIVRTAGVGKNVEELQWDLNYLLQLWQAIEKAGQEKPAPTLIYQESNIIIRAIRDYLRADIGEILIDDEKTFNYARDFMQHVMPHNLKRVKRYDDTAPLFSRYQIESQIETAFQHEVRLPSGGAIVIDRTEALVSIDINSARATQGGDIEETALNTNLEASDEIARQLRLRDLGGLVVIDYIDMTPARNQRAVENRLRDALKLDRARVQIGRISRFGLLEMSRQRLRPSLVESIQILCPRCKGEGSIRHVESLALSMLRLIEEEAMKEKSARIEVQLPIQAATFLLNEKRAAVAAIEERHAIHIVVIPNPSLETPDYKVQRIRVNDLESETTRQGSRASYQKVDIQEDKPEQQRSSKPKGTQQEAVVQGVRPATPPPNSSSTASTQTTSPQRAAESSFIKRLWETLFGTTTQNNPVQKSEEAQPAQRSHQNKGRGERTGSSTGQTKNRSSSNRGNRSRSSSRRGGQNRGQRTNTDTNANISSSNGEKQQNSRNKSVTPENAETVEQKSSLQQADAPTAATPSETQSENNHRPSRNRRGGRRRRRSAATNREKEPTPGGNNTLADATSASQDATPSKAPETKVAKPDGGNSDNKNQSQTNSENITRTQEVPATKTGSAKPSVAAIKPELATQSETAKGSVVTAAPQTNKTVSEKSESNQSQQKRQERPAAKATSDNATRPAQLDMIPPAQPLPVKAAPAPKVDE